MPYELPSLVQFECFVPGEGLCLMAVELCAEDIQVEEVRRADGTFLDHALGYPSAVLEQAGDVCEVFERALSTQDRDAQRCRDNPEDLRILSTIAEMALLESDLHTAWCRLPEAVVGRISAAAPLAAERRDGAPNQSLTSFRVLRAFIEQVLVLRAQDVATAAAKRREAQWNEGSARDLAMWRDGEWTDLRIDIAKEDA